MTRADTIPADPVIEAHTCYAHLAGRAGVALFAALLARGYVALPDGPPETRNHRPAVQVTSAGRGFFSALGYDGPLAGKACLDGTERRPHLAGPLGREFTRFLVHRGLIARRSGIRAVTPVPGWLATLGLADSAAGARPDAA